MTERLTLQTTCNKALGCAVEIEAGFRVPWDVVMEMFLRHRSVTPSARLEGRDQQGNGQVTGSWWDAMHLSRVSLACLHLMLGLEGGSLDKSAWVNPEEARTLNFLP